MIDDPLVFRSLSDGILVAPPHCGLLAIPGFVHLVHSACATTTRRQLLVDLSNVKAIDPGAFRALLWARRYCTARRITLAVAPPPTGVLPPPRAALLRDLFPASPRE